jgi:hypothetical protein
VYFLGIWPQGWLRRLYCRRLGFKVAFLKLKNVL